MVSLCPDALLIRFERLYGFRLAFCGIRDGEAWLTIRPCPNSYVPVALWKVTAKDKERLDWTETRGQLYDRMNFLIHSVPCFIYVMKPTYPQCRPSKEYFQAVEAGYREMGFDLLDLNSARF